MPEEHLARFRVGAELMLAILNVREGDRLSIPRITGMPRDAKIVEIWWSNGCRCWEVLAEHPSFPLYRPGSEVQVLGDGLHAVGSDVYCLLCGVSDVTYVLRDNRIKALGLGDAVCSSVPAAITVEVDDTCGLCSGLGCATCGGTGKHA